MIHLHFEVEGKGLCQADRHEDPCWYMFTMTFSLLGVEDTMFSSSDDKVCEWNFVGDVLVLIPVNNVSCNQVPVEEAGVDPYGILIEEAPEFATVFTGEKLNLDHFIYGLVKTFYFSIDLRGIYSSGFKNSFMVNTELHGVF